MSFNKKAILLVIFLLLMLALSINTVREAYKVESGKWRVQSIISAITFNSQLTTLH